ncbi:hypothetical protein QFC24_002529 [Naganishia onofrii]|uniref:Uncharacterized protein n=1 Tax=Naganishia onofrii TaxID=1851511 RepID=A0ACC2XQU9_9TREE|nr:hypothetical protein QFC24_002529 [Naganishia onofrii]
MMVSNSSSSPGARSVSSPGKRRGLVVEASTTKKLGESQTLEPATLEEGRSEDMAESGNIVDGYVREADSAHRADDAEMSKTRKASPKLLEMPTSPRSRVNEPSPRIVGRSPLLSPALLGAGGPSRLDAIPEHDHPSDHTRNQPQPHLTNSPLPLSNPPPLVLGPTFSLDSVSSLAPSLPLPVTAAINVINVAGAADDASQHGTDVDTIGPAGEESDTTVDPRVTVPESSEGAARRKGKTKRSFSVSVSVSSGFEKIKNMIGKGKMAATERTSEVQQSGTGHTSRASSRRSSVSSVDGRGTPVLLEGEKIPQAWIPSVRNDAPLAGILIRKDENVLKLTRTGSISSASSSLSNPTSPVSRTTSSSPRYIPISTSSPPDIDIESPVVLLDALPKPTMADSASSGSGLVPPPSPSPSPSPRMYTPNTDMVSPVEPSPTETTPSMHTLKPLTMNVATPDIATTPLPPIMDSTPASPQQSRRTSLTNVSSLKNRSFDEEAHNLMLNALQRGSGGGNNHSLSLSRSSTKDSAMTGGNKPGVGGALAALGFKTAAAVGATDTVKKSNINVIHPSQPLGSDQLAPPLAPAVSLTAATPMMQQEESGQTASSSGYFGSRKTKRSSRSDRSAANKEDKYRRSLSPFFKGRRSLSRGNASEKRDPSPPVGALSDAGESDGESVVSNSNRYRPQATAFSLSRRRAKADSDEEDDDDQGSDDGISETDTEYDEDALSHEVVGPDGWVEDVFDPLTEENTKANAAYFEGDAAGLGGEGVLEDDQGEEIEVEVDALGEGPNVVIPPEPIFAQPTMRRPPTPPVHAESGMVGAPHKEKKKIKPLPLTTSRPEFGRNRCTIKLTQGDPDAALEESGNRLRSYVVLSDLSAEAGYAIEWCIGTVARDGDEIFLVSVMENEAKVDPKDHVTDKAQKLRIQRERQATASALARQATSLLQRTVLNVSVTCQAIHSKNARHMLLDLIDYLEPTMAIVGSRGLGKLQGILLGSTSHYLVQKSSVPVMVARRRLKRPLRKTDPTTLRHAPRTSLASASIEKQASSKQEDEVLDAEDVDREADRQEIEDRQEREARGRAAGGQGEVTL